MDPAHPLCSDRVLAVIGQYTCPQPTAKLNEMCILLHLKSTVSPLGTCGCFSYTAVLQNRCVRRLGGRWSTECNQNRQILHSLQGCSSNSHLLCHLHNLDESEGVGCPGASPSGSWDAWSCLQLPFRSKHSKLRKKLATPYADVGDILLHCLSMPDLAVGQRAALIWIAITYSKESLAQHFPCHEPVLRWVLCPLVSRAVGMNLLMYSVSFTQSLLQSSLDLPWRKHGKNM